MSKDLMALMKLRLASLVVFSSILGYILATGWSGIEVLPLLALIIGGTLVTGASNGLNQVIERDTDQLMERTKDRPLATGRLSVTSAMVFCVIIGILGLGLIWYFTNFRAFVLSLMALVSYVGIYTPMKRMSSWSVFVGAFPGAIPPMLGYVAATGEFGLIPGALFAIQFIWQFPHFWSIAWVLHDDYSKAGFKMLPSAGGKDNASAFQIFLYSLFLIPVSLLPWMLEETGNVSAIICVVLSSVFAVRAYLFYKAQDTKSAKQLMFTTFFYLPLLQIAFVLDKI